MTDLRVQVAGPTPGAGRGDVPHAMGRADFVPAQRYYDPAFADLERARLWPHVWQMACRLEEIPEPGDYVEYTICDQSLLVVGSTTTTVRAYLNACRHRATELAKGTGSFSDGRIICPFHGWRWDLEGRNSFVYGAHAFDQASAGSRGAVSPTGPRRYCGAPARGSTSTRRRRRCSMRSIRSRACSTRSGVADMRVHWWKKTILPANWKMAQEAFMEGYHVPQTHPQLTLGHPEQYDPDSLVYSVYDRGHSSFQLRPNAQAKKGQQVGVSEIDAIIESVRLLSTGLEAMTLPREVQVVEGMRFRQDPRREHLRCRVGQGHLRVRRRCGDPASATRSGRAGPMGRNVLHVPQLLRAPPVRQRARLPGPAQR